MNNIFWDLITQGIIIFYLDNILIFTQTLEEHHRVVLEVLAKHKLYLWLEKCKFDKQQMEDLGLVILKK